MVLEFFLASSSPLNRTEPELGFSIPVMARTMVVLPAPLEPRMATISPSSRVKLMSHRILTEPYPAFNPSTFSMYVLLLCPQIDFHHIRIIHDLLRRPFRDLLPMVEHNDLLTETDHCLHDVLD